MILYRYHLIKIYGISLIFDWHLLIFKSHLARAKWLKMIPGAQLMIQILKLLLYLCIITSRPRILLEILANVIQKVTFNGALKTISHIRLGYTCRRPHLAQNGGFFLGVLLVWLILHGTWILQVCRVGEWGSGHVSDDEVVSICVGSKICKISALGELCAWFFGVVGARTRISF